MSQIPTNQQPPNLLAKLEQQLPYYDRYVNLARHNEATAAKQAYEDFLTAEERNNIRHDEADSEGRKYVCKMFATDFFVTAAKLSPSLITDAVIEAFRSKFFECNDSSQINIMKIMALLMRKDCLSFLECVASTPPSIRWPDRWVPDAAGEAIQVIRGQREIGNGDFI